MFAFSSTGAFFFSTASWLTLVSRRSSNEEPSLPRFARAFAESMRDVSNAERAGPIAERAGVLTEMSGRVASLLDPMMELAGSIQKSWPRSSRAGDRAPRRPLGSSRAKRRSRRPRPEFRYRQLRSRRALRRGDASEHRFRGARLSNRVELRSRVSKALEESRRVLRKWRKPSRSGQKPSRTSPQTPIQGRIR
jgi:hypothetical protein